MYQAKREGVVERRIYRLACVGVQSYLSSTSRTAVGKSSNGWQRTSATGISPSRGSHATALIACGGVATAHAVTGREYRPIAGHRRAGGCPALIEGCLSLPVEMLSADRGATSKVAHAHHDDNGNVLDEWVCGFQGARGKGQRKAPSLFQRKK